MRHTRSDHIRRTPSFTKFFFQSRGRNTRSLCDWSSDVCSSDLRAALRRAVDPRLGEQPPLAPQAAALHHQAETRLVARVDEDAAAPMAAARNRFDRAPVDLDRRVAVAAPAPIRRGAERRHERVAEDLRQRSAEETQQRQAEAVDADVVVLPEAAGCPEPSGLALAAAALEHEIAGAGAGVRPW